MAIKVEMNGTDIFRVYNGADPGTDPLAGSLIFSAAYAPHKVTKYTVAVSGSARAVLNFSASYTQPPLVAGAAYPTGTGATPYTHRVYHYWFYSNIYGWSVYSPFYHFYYHVRTNQLEYCYYDTSAANLVFWVYEP